MGVCVFPLNVFSIECIFNLSILFLNIKLLFNYFDISFFFFKFIIIYYFIFKIDFEFCI